MTGYFSRANRGINQDSYGLTAQNERQDMAVEVPAEIVAMDHEKQVALVRALYKPRFNGEPIDLPLFQEVPIRQYRDGAFAITSPLGPGSPGTLKFHQIDHDNWYEDGGAQPAATARMNSWSDAVFEPGGQSAGQVIPAYNAENMEIRSIGGTARLEMAADQIEIHANGEKLFQIIFELLDHLSRDRLWIKKGSSLGKVHELEFKAKYEELFTRISKMRLA